MRLQIRLALTVALAAALAILMMAAAFWVLSARQQRADIDSALLRVVNQPRQILDDVRPGRQGDNDQGLPEVAATDLSKPRLSTVEISGDRYRMVAAVVGDRDGVLQVARNIEDLEDGLSMLRRQILLGSLIGIALAGFLGAMVARRLTAPIESVAAAARSITTSSELPSPIEVDRGDEVGDLANSFNSMLSALEISREQQQRLVGDASHELRTPLTSLRLKIDLLDSTPDLPQAKRQELLSSSAGEVEQLGELVSELVDLATDATGVDEVLVSTSLPQLVRDVADRQAHRSGRMIEVIDGGSSQEVPLRNRMVRRAVSNLIDNAIKYSEDDAKVMVTVGADRVEVRDRGSGIPDADLPHVFDRFYRSPSARTRPGNGIGLAIVQRVAEVHGGTTWAKNTDAPPGAIVGFSINSESVDA